MHLTISEKPITTLGSVAGNSEATCVNREALETNTLSILRDKAAYYAGFFDADGYIGVSLQDNKYGGKSYASEVKIGVSVDHKKSILREMNAECGGNLRQAGKALHLAFRIDEAGPFLKALYPFLILKKPQAALWFKFREVLKQKDRHGYRHELRLALMNKLNSTHASQNGPLGRPRPDWREEEIISYAAGLIDGDGTIRKNKHRCLIVNLTAKAKTLPEWLQNVFGGSLFTTNNYERNCSYWQWAVYSKNANAFLARLGDKCVRRMMIESEHIQEDVTRQVIAA